MNPSNLSETNVLLSSAADSNQPESTTVNTSGLTGMDIDVFRAAREGNIDALREHREHLVQKLTPTNNTVLHIYIACTTSVTLSCDYEQLLKSSSVVQEILIMCPPLLLQPNKSGDTALHIAARHGRADLVSVLMQAARDHRGDLEKGVSTEEACVKMLIRAANNDQNSALHEAARFNHLAVVKILTREDPEFLYRANVAGETPLYLAAERGYSDVVFELLDTCSNPAYQGPHGLTALHAAVIYNDEKMTRKLLETDRAPALTKATDEDGITPLHLAAFWGHTSIVKQILECDKSTAYVGDSHKMTPLHFAGYKGHVDVMKELILSCPDCCELVDEKQRNVLHCAITNNHEKVEQFIRKDPWLSSVLLNGKDADGNTPLHQIAASLYNGMDFISDLRVDKMAFNKQNQNAFDIILNGAVSIRKADLIDRLTKTGARRGRRIFSYEGGRRKIIETTGDENPILKEMKEAHLVVSALIATVTFAAAFSVPGGYQSEKGPDQGFAVLTRNAAFKAFVIADTLAMTMSSCAVMISFFLSLRRLQLAHGSNPFLGAIGLTTYALIAMAVAFLTGTYAVLGHSSIALAIAGCVLGCYFCFVHSFVLIFRDTVIPLLRNRRIRNG